jgi:hypothetical protein
MGDYDTSEEEDELIVSILVGMYRNVTEEQRWQHTMGERKVDMRDKN